MMADIRWHPCEHRDRHGVVLTATAEKADKAEKGGSDCRSLTFAR
jgi:hypothetical protein